MRPLFLVRLFFEEGKRMLRHHMVKWVPQSVPRLREYICINSTEYIDNRNGNRDHD